MLVQLPVSIAVSVIVFVILVAIIVFAILITVDHWIKIGKHVVAGCCLNDTMLVLDSLPEVWYRVSGMQIDTRYNTLLS